MLNSLREGPLTTFFDSDGSAGDYDAVDGSQTVLFRWQGSLVPVQVRKEVQNPNSISKQFYHQHILAETKWPPFRRLYFQMHFLK